MASVSIHFHGGTQLRQQLGMLRTALGSGRHLAVGFLENATYPPRDGSRLRRALRRLTPALELQHPDWRPKLEAWAAWADRHHPVVHVAQVAFWNEFGTRYMRPRPFFRNTIRAHAGDWGRHLLTFLQANEGRRDQAARSLRQLGVLIRDQLDTAINEWPRDNRPFTAFIKNFNKGLIDSRVMARSLDIEVS